MVSTEEEMIQKDKEAIVLKTNHKHQIMLNLELERIEKCRRTYESAHHSEVMWMKARCEKIARKKAELRRDMDSKINKTYDNKVMVSQEQDEPTKYNILTGKSAPHGRTSCPRNANSRQTNGSTNETTERFKYFNTSIGKSERISPNQTKMTSSEKTQHGKSSRAVGHTNKSDQNTIKFPGLTFHSADPSPTPCQVRVSENYLERSPNAHGFSPKFYKAKNSKKRKTVRSHVEDTTPFDRYRLKLQESEEKTRKSKPQFARAMSAVQEAVTWKGPKSSVYPSLKDRRVCSADAQ